MKKWIAMLIGVMLMMMALGALAEDDRGVIFAKTGGEVAMHEQANEDSDVLMNYFDGTLVTVLASEGEWTQIRVGTDEAGLTGYVPSDAVHGVEAMREHRWADHSVVMEYVKAYAAPDENAAVIHKETTEIGAALNICGYNDEWVQRCSDGRVKSEHWSGGADEGFLRRLGSEIYTSEPVEDNPDYMVQPLEGELTHEQAYDLAIKHAAGNPAWLYRFDEDDRDEESLRAMWWDVRCVYHSDTGEITWCVFIQKDAEEYEENICITMDADGKLMDMESGNG